ncbi:metalloregulator ArsR/SmtB family transcription factor [Devosia sp. 2618]|uniref:ArsR/SmtB family transcription factor n=1 Tax=Devosia sp. 2618 TaxID=3156454 RepID=UPI003396350A
MANLVSLPHLAMLSALAQETRLATFRALVTEGPEGLPAGEISRIIGTPSNTMSTHLAILERSGLITSRRDGRSIIYTADLSAMQNLVLFLVQDCCQGNPGVSATVADILSAASPCDPKCAPDAKQLA